MEPSEKRDAIIKKICDFYEHVAGISGIYLSGSMALCETDDVSDIDLRLVIGDEMDKSAVLSVLTENKIEESDKILFVSTVNENYAVIHYENFIKLDCFVYHVSEIIPSNWLKEIKILKDKNDFLRNIKEKSCQLSYVVTQKTFDFYLVKFYSNVQEVYRRRKRGEFHYALECELWVKNANVAFWMMAKGRQPNSLGDWSKYEGRRSKLNLDQINQLKMGQNSYDFETFQSQWCDPLLSVLTEIASRYKLEFDEKIFKKVMKCDRD